MGRSSPSEDPRIFCDLLAIEGFESPSQNFSFLSKGYHSFSGRARECGDELAVRTQLTTALSVFPPFIIHERLDAHPTGWQKRRLAAESRRRARQES